MMLKKHWAQFLVKVGVPWINAAGFLLSTPSLWFWAPVALVGFVLLENLDVLTMWQGQLCLSLLFFPSLSHLSKCSELYPFQNSYIEVLPLIWSQMEIQSLGGNWEYQTTWPASWETHTQVKKQQLELDMEQQTGSK